jgi:hypothetical protein
MSKIKLETEIKKLYRRLGVNDIPFIWASSMPVGAMLAPILAHTKELTKESITLAHDEARILALGAPDRALVEKHRGSLSHRTKSGGKGAYCKQPGGSIGLKMPRTAPGTGAWPHDNASGIILQAGIERTRTRIHILYEARVKYHFMMDYFMGREFLLEHGRYVTFWPNKRFCVVCDKPTRVLLNNNRQAHSTEKPAIRYSDGWSIAAVGGIPVPLRFFKDRDLLTPKVIQRTPNVETKRALIELYGYERYLHDTDAHLVDQNTDQDGREQNLWSFGVTMNVGINLLEVFNSTPEPDGTFKKYFLQVPSTIHHIHTALNWMLDDRHDLNLKMRIET